MPSPTRRSGRVATRAASTPQCTTTTDNDTVAEGSLDLERARRILARLHDPAPLAPRKALREDWQPPTPTADVDLFDAAQRDAWLRGDFWGAIGAVFVPHRGEVRAVSLAEAKGWAA